MRWVWVGVMLLSSVSLTARDRLSPLEVTQDLLGLTEADLLMLRSPGVDEAKWCNSKTHDCFRLIRNGNKQALYREGDFQVYVEDLVSLQNLSMSRNRGATYGAYPILKDSTLFLYGGYGFWHTNRAVVHFSKATSGWEASHIHTIPHQYHELHEGAFRVGEQIFWSPWLAGETFTEETNLVWRTEIATGFRDIYGKLPLTFSTLKPVQFFETSQFVLFLDFVNRAHIIRKSDLHIAELQNKNLVLQLNAIREIHHIQLVREDAIELWKDGNRAVAFDVMELSETIGGDQWMPLLEKASIQVKIQTWRDIFGQILNELKRTQGIELDFAPIESEEEGCVLKYILIGAIGLGGGVLGWGTSNWMLSNASRRRKSRIVKMPHLGNHPESPRSEKISISPELAQLLKMQSKALTTSQFDDLMGLDNDGVAETKRARRSKIIKDVQAESSRLLGAEILIRKRSEDDARKVNYKIRDFSSDPVWHSLQEFLEVEEEGEATK